MIRKLVFCLLLSSVASAELSVNEIIDKSDATRRLKDMYSKVTLSTEGKEGGDKVKKFKYWQKLKPGSDTRFDRLTRFEAPAKIKDEGILFLEKPNDVRDIWMYLPRFKKNRRIENNQQSGSFMGTVFSFSDISTPASSDLKHKLLRKEKCPKETKANTDCYVVRSVGKNKKILDRTGYAYTDNWIRADNFLGVQSLCYDRSEKLAKKIVTTNFDILDKSKNLWIAKKIEAWDVKTKAYSSFVIDEYDIKKDISPSMFSTDALENP